MSFIAISGRLDWDPALVFEPDETPFVRCRVKTHHEPAVVYNVEARGDAADNAAVAPVGAPGAGPREAGPRHRG